MDLRVVQHVTQTPKGQGQQVRAPQGTKGLCPTHYSSHSAETGLGLSFWVPWAGTGCSISMGHWVLPLWQLSLQEIGEAEA